MAQFSLLKDLVGWLVSTFVQKTTKQSLANIAATQEKELIMKPTHESFQQEIKLRTEEFDKYQMSETVKDLEKAVYHLSASVSQLKDLEKKNEERLVYLATTNEEMLHMVEDYLTTPDTTTKSVEHSSSTTAGSEPPDQQDLDDNNDDDDDLILSKAWDSGKKGLAGLN